MQTYRRSPIRLRRPIGVTRREHKSRWGHWTIGYQVNFSYEGRRYTKFFADKKHGGEVLAWSAACTWLWQTRAEIGAPWKFQWHQDAKPVREPRDKVKGW